MTVFIFAVFLFLGMLLVLNDAKGVAFNKGIASGSKKSLGKPTRDFAGEIGGRVVKILCYCRNIHGIYILLDVMEGKEREPILCNVFTWLTDRKYMAIPEIGKLYKVSVIGKEVEFTSISE
ncbi:MAG: hypothetical protein WC827_00250 [Candidatus Paceibacterota bacterium]|jgi:hypothetical protein